MVPLEVNLYIYFWGVLVETLHSHTFFSASTSERGRKSDLNRRPPKHESLMIPHPLPLGAMKRGRGTCSTFKAFNLTYLHILRS